MDVSIGLSRQQARLLRLMLEGEFRRYELRLAVWGRDDRAARSAFSRATARLRERGLISYERYGRLELTDVGIGMLVEASAGRASSRILKEEMGWTKDR